MIHTYVTFDPRTKMLLLMTMAIFVLGGAGDKLFGAYLPLFCLLPFVLFILVGKWKRAAGYIILYSVFYLLTVFVLPHMTRFLPGIMAGTYLMQTTTVSEFSSAMSRMHVTDKLTIPLSVMFRFFPTIADEFRAINDAMRMRDIRFGGKNVDKMIEYRLIPLMVCSAKIGEELNAAAITRGLGGDVKRTNVCRIGFHFQDYIVVLICFIPYVIWIVSMISRLFM